MRDAMNKLLTEVLLNLSKISATVYIAIPILEFLSSKSRMRIILYFYICIRTCNFYIRTRYTGCFISTVHHVYRTIPYHVNQV